MSKTEREKYLINLGNEVITTYGPGYFRENIPPTISKLQKFRANDKRSIIQNNVGREFYELTYPYDPAKETLDWNYAALVKIWKDNGQPFSVLFGNGVGRSFFFEPYIKPNARTIVKQVPYQQANPIVPIFDTIQSPKR